MIPNMNANSHLCNLHLQEKVNFRVLIQNTDVKEVILVLRRGKISYKYEMESKNVKETHYLKSNWTLASKEIWLPPGEEYQYDYIMTASTSSYQILHNTTEKHSKSKVATSPLQVYDVFPTSTHMFPWRSKANDAASEASLLYVDMLLMDVSSISLKQAIIDTEIVGFPGVDISKQFAETAITWISNKICQDSVGTPASGQIKLLAILLGKVLRKWVN